MKKIVASILCVLLSITPAFASGIDWGSMTDQQITMAIAEAEAELDNRAANGETQAAPVKEVTVPIGVWIIGEDIPVGHWTIKVAPDQKSTWGSIQVGTVLDETGKEIDGFESDYYYYEQVRLKGASGIVNLEELDYDFKEGAILVIDNADMIFTPYQGKPKLGF